MKSKTAKSQKSGRIYHALVIVLSVFLALSVFMLVNNVRDDMSWYIYNAENMSYDYTRYDYQDLVRKMHENESHHVKADDWMEEYYAVARYYEAALRRNAYAKAGQEERAASYQAVMEEQISLMGPYTDCVQKIEELLQ